MASEDAASTSPTAGRSPRPAEFVLFMGVALVVVGAVVYCWSLRPPAFRLTADPQILTLSADEVPPDQGLRREVTIDLVNTGREALEVTSAETSCHCTMAGPLPKEPLQPEERASVILRVDLPHYGQQQTRVEFLTNPPGEPSTTLVLNMQGRTIQTPFVNEMPRPAQLMARRPGELVRHLFEVETTEAIASDPWLTGMHSDVPEARVELLDVRTVRENDDGKFVNRAYQFQLEIPAPVDAQRVLAFSLTEEGATPSAGRVQPYLVRVSYVPAIRVVPQEILMVINDDTDFPLVSTLELVSDEEVPRSSVGNVLTTCEWMTAQRVANSADVSPPSTEATPSRVIVQLNNWPEDSRPDDEDPSVLVGFGDADVPLIRVPVTVVDRRSL